MTLLWYYGVQDRDIRSLIHGHEIMKCMLIIGLQTNKLIHRSISYCLQKYMFVNKCRVSIHIYFIKQLCVDIESHILPHGGLLFIVYRSAGSHNSSIIGISTLAYISVSISYWQHTMWKKHPTPKTHLSRKEAETIKPSNQHHFYILLWLGCGVLSSSSFVFFDIIMNKTFILKFFITIN